MGALMAWGTIPIPGRVYAAASTSPAQTSLALPPWFESNLGQAAPQYHFVVHGRGMVQLLAPDGVAVWLAPAEGSGTVHPSRRVAGEFMAGSQTEAGRWLRFRWLGANAAASSVAVDPLPGRVHYLLGPTPETWIRNVPLSGAVRFKAVYHGIDLEYRVSERMLEVVFMVAPGAHPEQIRLAVEGADRVHIDAHGDLVVQAGASELRQHRPRAFQTTETGWVEIACAYTPSGEHTIAFRLGSYDRERPLIIDPVFRHASYLGGAGQDVIWAVATDANGAGYLVGETTSATWFGRTAGFQTNYAGGTPVGGDAFVAKVTPDGTQLVYFTYLGGWSHDGALAVAVDPTGAVYLTGFTASSNFPTVQPFQANLAGRPDPALGAPPLDAFVVKLASSGDQLVYSTFFGGDGTDQGIGLAVDQTGQVAIVGLTESTNLPLAHPTQTAAAGGQDAFVARFSPDGRSLVFSTYMGGSGLDYASGAALDPSGRLWVTGVTRSTNFWSKNPIQSRINDPRGLATNLNTLPDAFICRFSSLSSLEMASYLGGSLTDAAARIAIDRDGHAYVAGTTESGDFPVTTTNLVGAVWTNRASADLFVTKIAAHNATGWVYSVAFGGTDRDEAWDVAVDPGGTVHIIGFTSSTNFPVWDAPPGSRASLGGPRDVVLAAIDSTGQALRYAFLYGGTGSDFGYALALDPAGHLWIGGRTLSTNLWTHGALQPAFAGGPGDAFFARLLQPPTLQIRLLSAQLVELCWPAPSPEWELIRRTHLTNDLWERVVGAPPPSSGLHRVALPITSTPAWFRLRLP